MNHLNNLKKSFDAIDEYALSNPIDLNQFQISEYCILYKDFYLKLIEAIDIESQLKNKNEFEIRIFLLGELARHRQGTKKYSKEQIQTVEKFNMKYLDTALKFVG